MKTINDLKLEVNSLLESPLVSNEDKEYLLVLNEELNNPSMFVHSIPQSITGICPCRPEAGC